MSHSVPRARRSVRRLMLATYVILQIYPEFGRDVSFTRGGGLSVSLRRIASLGTTKSFFSERVLIKNTFIDVKVLTSSTQPYVRQTRGLASKDIASTVSRL